MRSSRCEPFGHRCVTLLAADEVLERKHSRGNARGLGACKRARVGSVRRDRDDRQALVEQSLEVRSFTGNEDPDHERTIFPITKCSPGSLTTAQYPMPTLKTRRNSSSSTCCASQRNTGGRSHAFQSSSARRPS